jgi:peroxiredoxin Q/BCP
MIKKKPKKKSGKSVTKRSAVKSRATTAKLAKKTRSRSAPKPRAKSPPAAAKTDDRSSSVAGGGLREGASAPAFSLTRDGGKRVSLADFAGSKLVIYFYPRADTPGCTREAMDFTRLAKDFASAGAEVIGVSADAVAAQDAFRDKYRLGVPLVSDETKGMIKAYGAWGEKSMYGRTFEGILRTTVLLDGEAKVLKIWRHVRVDGHAQDVLDAARAGPPGAHPD